MAIIDLLNTKKQYDDKALGAGSVGGATISAAEKTDASGQLHKTTLTLVNTPLPMVSVTTGNGVDGVTLYTMPEGYITMHYATAHLSLAIDAADQADFTDGTPEGDIGLGTLAPANADALGTDATDDNLCTAAAFTMAAYALADLDLAFDGSTTYAGDETAMNVVLTGLTDAADIDDDVTSQILVSGTVEFVWQNLGDL